jgi:sulfate/thiosulfate-binding protein
MKFRAAFAVLITAVTFTFLFFPGCKQHTDDQTASTQPATEPSVSTILNVSYDPTRELYKAINVAFAADYKAKTGQDITVQQSHGGSGKQARAVIDGLQADVVTLGLAYDIDALHEHGNLVPADWQKRLPNNSTPFTSTIVFLVRKGNPKGIKTWDDLVKDGVSIIVANPKTSGGARWAYLAGYGATLLANNNDDAKAHEYITKFYGNVPVLDSGARDATVTFTKRQLGDVLVSWENEAALALKEFGADQYEVVYPPTSILAEPPVSVVDQVVDSRGSRKVAEAYLNFLYTQPAQEIAAKNFYRPTDASVAARYVSQLPQIKLFNIDDVFGGWKKAQKTHFADGGVFDQIYKPKS